MMLLLKCRYPLFISIEFKWKKKKEKERKKEKKNVKNIKSKWKINNNHFLLRFYNTAFDVTFVQMIFSMLEASSYNYENK